MFESLKPLPPDAIIGIMALYRADQDPRKVDLSVGVYQDDKSRTPVLDCVKRAERELLEKEDTKTYVAIAGNAGFNRGMEELVFGRGSAPLKDGRVATIQAPGGSGAICVIGHLVRRAKPDTTVYLSDPSWPNHLPLLKLAGLKIETYPYYDYHAHRVDFEAMLGAVERMGAGNIVLVHGCCHNPCGADLVPVQWEALAKACAKHGVVPFVDFAYQGLAEGLEPDAYGVRVMAEHCEEVLVVSSCSKNLGLYRERLGSASVVSANATQRDAASSNLSNVARGIYSMPPDHGAAIFDIIMHAPELRELWMSELEAMRTRLNGLRQLFVDELAERGADFSFVARERGLFSFLGLGKEQIVRLREEFHVYMVESSRINVAGINRGNVDYVADAIAAVL